MLRFDGNLKEANLSEVKKNRGNKMKVVLATGMALVTFCSGCKSQDAETNKQPKAWEGATETVIYQVNDKEAVLFDDTCFYDIGYTYHDADVTKITLPEDYDSRTIYEGNYIRVNTDKLTFVYMPDSYTVAENMAHEMVGEDGIVINYKDYFENMRGEGKSR